MNINVKDGDGLPENLLIEGLEEMSLDVDESEDNLSDGDGHGNEDEAGDDELVDYIEYDNQVDIGADFVEEKITINAILDIYNIDMENLTFDVVKRLDFADLDLAYEFYTWYSRVIGFSVRKSHNLRNKKGEIYQKTFLCSRAGEREDRGLTLERRKRQQKNETRCNCEAMFRVHIDNVTQRWFVVLFNFDHNHEFLEEEYCSLLPLHRKMTTADIMQIENFRKVGISTPHIYAAFASSAGGYHKVGFVSKDIYNQVSKQRKERMSDVNGALNYFRELGSKDPMLYVSYTVDDASRLQHLFWADAESQLNYEIFGDVLAFDATYKKNKYLCPLVVFSGVNNHNQTIVFAAALVTNETEETYVWLLEQFLEAMNGKSPNSVITDGDVAMKNAIHRVFPNAHHRLCAWHLLRNAVSNVKNDSFVQCLKRLMLGDLDVDDFEIKWAEMVDKFGLQDNTWVTELYERRRMWATAHIRGHFFAGIRTTSRCEAFHSHVSKYVHSKICLTDFVEQFQRCLTYFRFREVEAEHNSKYGNVKTETNFRFLEMSAGNHLTKEMFLIFRKYLVKATMLRVVDCHEMPMLCIYTLVKYRSSSKWHVSYCPSTIEFKCSCLRMESYGLPCDHILAVMLSLNICELPNSLVLHRWSKYAKDSIKGRYPDSSIYWDSNLMCRYANLVHLSKEVFELAYRDEEDYGDVVRLLTGELGRLKLKHHSEETNNVVEIETQTITDVILDPPIVRTKGCGTSTTTPLGRSRHIQTCGKCGERGHNKRSCTQASRVDRATVVNETSENEDGPFGC